MSYPTISPEITPVFFQKQLIFPGNLMWPANPVVVVADPCFSPNILSPAEGILTFAENFLCRNHYFSKSPRQETFFYVPTMNYCRFFIKIS